MCRPPIGNKRFPSSELRGVIAAAFFFLFGVVAAPAQNSAADSAETSPAQSNASSRGQKLVLKDGTFQLVREYEVNGDRIRYYSLDTHQWEEMPTSLVDWEATKKEAAKEAQQATSLVKAVNEREKEENAQPLTVDASIEPAPGIFLPPDNGLFAFDGKQIVVVNKADMKSSVSKIRALEKVMIPVPIVPSRHVISITGKKAKLRLTNGQPEFYLRSAAPGQPEIDLVRAKVKGNEREVENVDELMGETAEKRKEVALQRWQLAPNVYRYTVAKPLEPGEYVLVQNIPNDQYSIYLWDFGIDSAR
ncbi:MAG: hypothetical protein ACRD40_07685 [Candidatus Acidiferrales bacterium]